VNLAQLVGTMHKICEVRDSNLVHYQKKNISSNEGKGDALFAKLFEVYHCLMLVINNSIQRVICETNSLEVRCLLQNPDHSHMHLSASLLVKIFRLKEHISNISFQRVLREGNHCAYFLAKFGRSSRLGVTF
jgi:hypothetical protein